MYNIIDIEILEAFHNLFQKDDSLVFLQFPLFLKIVIEIIVAYLRDNVHIIVRLEDIKQIDNVSMIDLLHDVYL